MIKKDIKDIPFNEMLLKSIRGTKAKCYKDANKRIIGFEDARKKVLNILDRQKNKVDGYFKEFAENFIIKFKDEKFFVTNTQKAGFEIEDNIPTKILYLSSVTTQNYIRMSVAELINHFMNNDIKFFTYENTRHGDMFFQIN
jgi:hypothetical protein